MEKTGNTWAAQDAKAKFSEVLDRVEAGAEQTITRHGKKIARIVPIADQEPKLTGADLLRALRSGPLFDLDIPPRPKGGKYRDFSFDD